MPILKQLEREDTVSSIRIKKVDAVQVVWVQIVYPLPCNLMQAFEELLSALNLTTREYQLVIASLSEYLP